MKLVTLECPKCGAQLELNPDLTQAFCNYCGFQFLVDDERKQVNINVENPRQIGYELERGKSAQRIEEGRDHADKVKKLIKPIAELNCLTNEKKYLCSQIEELRNKKNNTLIKSPVIFFGIPAMIVAATITWGDCIGTYIVGLVAAAILFAVCYCLQKYIRITTIKRLEEKTRQYENLCNRVDHITKENDINFIPPGYRNERAMWFFYQVLINQRALNLHQAINLYEEEKHKAEMKALQEEQLLIQKKQLQATEEQKKQLENVRDLKEEGNSDLSWGKAIVAGSVLLAAVSLLKNRDK